MTTCVLPLASSLGDYNGCRCLSAPTVISSLDEREEVVKCVSLGAIDYLVKPLRHNELRQLWARIWWHQVGQAC